MLMPDVNILVYAHRDDEKRHLPYAKWLKALIDGPEPFALSILVAARFLRMVTNRRIYPDPTPPAIALAAIEQISGHPRCRIVTPPATHLSDILQLCRSVSAQGKLIADAQHAALAIAEGCTWVTADGDFARFEPQGLRWQHLDL